jgi:hypothetical protein
MWINKLLSRERHPTGPSSSAGHALSQPASPEPRCGCGGRRSADRNPEPSTATVADPSAASTKHKAQSSCCGGHRDGTEALR